MQLEMKLPSWTYQDIASKLQVDARVVARWVCALEAAKLISPFRPTKRTVRLTDEEVEVLLAQRKTLSGSLGASHRKYGVVKPGANS